MQGLDTKIDRLTRQRETLPELEEIAAVRRRRAAASDDVVVVRTEVDDLGREQRKADADVELVKARRIRNQERLDKGQVGSPKELESLNHEIQSLERRITDLEDVELEVMERLEQAQATLDRLQTSITEYDVDLGQLEQRRDAAFGEIDAAVEAAAAERSRIVVDIADDLVALYEKLRTTHAGVGAAALVQRRCQGCQLELTAADLRAIAASDEDAVLRCEECSRILVRTSESGI
ncbi:MAG: zinc ribbon domain-containing protein [Nocardioidaceae bacterium]